MRPALVSRSRLSLLLVYINFSYFQEQIEKIFSSWASIWQHQEVIKFACGLSKQPGQFLEVIYSRLTSHLKDNWTDNIFPNFLQSLGRELSETMKFDVFHNRYFNYTTNSDPNVYMVTRFYRFDVNCPEKEAVTFQVDESTLNLPGVYCSISALCKDALNNILKILQGIQRHVKITVTSFHVSDMPTNINTHPMELATNDGDSTKLLKGTLKLGPSTLWFHINDCYLTQSAFKYIVQELRGLYVSEGTLA